MLGLRGKDDHDVDYDGNEEEAKQDGEEIKLATCRKVVIYRSVKIYFIYLFCCSLPFFFVSFIRRRLRRHLQRYLFFLHMYVLLKDTDEEPKKNKKKPYHHKPTRSLWFSVYAYVYRYIYLT